MSLAGDLVEQARHLLSIDPKRPKQANLRRAVSAAYYALFHLLVEASVKLLLPRRQQALRDLLARAFSHGEMRRVAQTFRGASLPADLVEAAQTFVALQEARHDADYNVARRFTRSEAQEHVDGAAEALASWERVQADPAAEELLVRLLIGMGRA